MKKIIIYLVIFTIATILGGGWGWGIASVVGFYFLPVR